jgi:hypothetical protein
MAVLNQAATFRQESRRHEDDEHAEPQQSATSRIEVRGDAVPRHSRGAARPISNASVNASHSSPNVHHRLIGCGRSHPSVNQNTNAISTAPVNTLT